VDMQARKLGDLVTRLLDVSRITSGRLTLEPIETDLAALVRGAADAARARTERHELIVDAPETLRATGDPVRLEQVVTNLLENAIKYSPGGGAIEVVLRTDDHLSVAEDERSSAVGRRSSGGGSERGGCVTLSVRDHGTGIPPEARDRIFDRFYQAHGAGHLSGLGLGLFISREIVDLHGGAIRAEFPEDGGTRIVVTLPAAQVSGVAGEAALARA
jgi:signal transduction histidine kinase